MNIERMRLQLNTHEIYSIFPVTREMQLSMQFLCKAKQTSLQFYGIQGTDEVKESSYANMSSR